jgi:hypothetical protein
MRQLIHNDFMMLSTDVPSHGFKPEAKLMLLVISSIA